MLYTIVYDKKDISVTNNLIPDCPSVEYRMGKFLIEFLEFEIDCFRYGSQIPEYNKEAKQDDEKHMMTINDHNFMDYTGEDPEWEKYYFSLQFEVNEDIPMFLRIYLSEWIDSDKKAYKEDGYQKVKQYQIVFQDIVDYIYEISNDEYDEERKANRAAKFADWDGNLAEIVRHKEIPEGMKEAESEIKDRYLAACGRTDKINWKNLLAEGKLDYESRTLLNVLEIELYSIVKNTIYIFKCGGCQKYSIGGKRNTKFCDRPFAAVWDTPEGDKFRYINDTYKKMHQEKAFSQFVKKIYGDGITLEKRKRLWEANAEKIKLPEDFDVCKSWITCSEYGKRKKYNNKDWHEIEKMKNKKRKWVSSKIHDLSGNTNVSHFQEKCDRARHLLKEANEAVELYKEKYNEAQTEEEREFIKTEYYGMYAKAANMAKVRTDINGNPIKIKKNR